MKKNEIAHNFIDITGKKFGMLTAIRRDGTAKRALKWLFKCDCGKEVSIIGKNVRKGISKSCGCNKDESRIKDLTNKKFGSLFVLERYGRENSTRKSITWKCLCSCGNTAIIRGSALVNGDWKTCGCGRGGVGQWMNKLNYF